jgi:dTDP-4-amino-4,6-dideoxygalactose transaminase
LVPTYTFLATVMPIFACNAVPVLVDADEWSGNLDPSDLERHITQHTKAIAVTHLNGFPVDMAAVMAIASKHGIKVVEDCCHAHGAICDGRKVGTFGDVAVFSTQAKKLVTGGEGGLMLTNHSRLHQRAVMLGHFRDRCYDEVTDDDYRELAGTGFGLNYRMHPIGAALAGGSLGRLEQTIATRTANFEHFSQALDGIPGIRRPVVAPHMTRPVYYSYQPLYVPEELDGLSIDVFVRAVAAEGVPISRPKSPPLHCEPAFQRGDIGLETYGPGGRGAGYRRYRAGDLPASESYVARALRFPSTYSEDVRPMLGTFAEAIAKVARHAGDLHALAADEGPTQLERMLALQTRRVGPMYRTGTGRNYTSGRDR